MNSNQKSVQVWDIFIRVFHWSLVVSFIIAYLTSEEKSEIHIYAGYTVLGLIIFRVIWGFWGTKYAKFGEFLTPHSQIVLYVKSLFSKRPKHYIGHNPLGGWMVIAMLFNLFMVSYSGLKILALKHGEGPLAIQMQSISPIAVAQAQDDIEQYLVKEKDEVSEDYWEELHEKYTNIMLILIGLHLAGVVVSSVVHKENLIKTMVTGKKTVNK